ncbi:MAG TPA: YceI family protein [Candidatus Limnocylindrales bacterium]
MAAVLVVVLLAAGAYGVWYLFLKPGGPAAIAEQSLPPVPSRIAAASASGAASGSAAAAGSSGAAASTATSGAIAGTWKVDTSIGSFSDFTDSFVGYRVQEELGSIGANTAVGRTPSVTGTMTLAGTTVTAATITADLTSLRSDDQRRDGQLSRQGLETSTFPTATFTLTSPIELGSTPVAGQQVAVTAKGTLNLHGQAKDVELPLKARLSNGVITVAGSLPIVFSDYGIQKPSSFAVLSIADQGTMELQLFFSRG